MALSKKTFRTLGVAVIALPMIMYGSLNYDTTLIEQPIVSIGEFTLTQSELDFYVEQERRRLGEQFGIDPADLGEEQEERIRTQVREQFIRSFLSADLIDRIGLRPQDKEVEEAVRADSRFSVDGTFSPERFRALVSDPQYYLNQVRENLSANKIEEAVQNAAITPPHLAEQLASFRGEVRAVRQISVPVNLSEDALAVVELSEEQLMDYYERNQASYEVPERAKLEYIWLEQDSYLDQVQIEEEQLKAEHEQRRATALASEELQLSLLELATELEARDAVAELDAGAEFAELARTRSLDAGSRAVGGDLGFLTRNDLEGKYAEEIFAAEVGAVVGPFDAGGSWQVFEVTGKIGAQVEEFEQVREQLLEEVKQFEVATIVAGVADRLSDLIVEQPTGLAAAAEQLEVTLQSSEWITSVSSIDELPEPFVNQQAIETAFVTGFLESGENSELLTLDDGSYLVMRAIAYEPLRFMPFEEVIAEVRSGATREFEIERIRGGIETILRELAGEPEPEVSDSTAGDQQALDTETDVPETQTLALDFEDAAVQEISRYGELPEEVSDADRRLIFARGSIIGSKLPAYVLNYSAGRDELLVYRIESITTGEYDEQLLDFIGSSIGQSEASLLFDSLVTELSAEREYSVSDSTAAADS